MPKMSPEPIEESTNRLEELSVEAVKGIIPYPVFICGVSRKSNIGNYENIDVYGGLALPIMELPQSDMEAFKELARATAELGFSITSRETGERYKKIKDRQEGG